MGIIIKQTIRGSIWSYTGVAIGFITTAYLFPNYLNTDVIGLFSLLLAWSTLFAQLSILGFNSVTARLFPYFRDKDKNHNGFLFITLGVFLFGSLLFLIAYFFLKTYLIKSNQENSELFAEYVYLLVPLTLFTMIFFLLDTYNKVLYDAMSGIFLQEFFQRVLLFLFTVLFAFKVFSLQLLIYAFAISVCIKAILIIIILYKRNELHFQPDLKFVDKKLKKEMIDVALFSLITGLGGMIIFNIDKILINQLLNLSETGVYTIAFYFGTLVIIPSRPLLKISGTLISDAWAKKDIEKVKEIYYKSCINLFIIGGFLFLGIWSNIDNILIMLGEEYFHSKWVIFFIGAGYLFDMMTGANAHVIAYSKHYRMSLVFILLLLGFVVGLFFILIPKLGIVGAAISIAIGFFSNNLLRFLFLFKKYRMQPFNRSFIIVSFFYIVINFILSFIPQQLLILDILIRGTIITVLTLLFLWFIPVSQDVHQVKNLLLAKIKKN